MTTNEPSRRFRTLVDQLSVPVFILDDSGIFEYVSSELANQIPSDDETGPNDLTGEPAVKYLDGVDDFQDAFERDNDEPVTVSFEEWKGSAPGFEVLRVEGALLGCPVDGAASFDEPTEFALVLEQLHDVTNKLYAAESIDRGLEIVIGAAVEVLGFDWCLLSEATDGVFMVRATSEKSPVTVGEGGLATDEGDAGAAYQSGSPRLTSNARASEVAEPTHDSIRSTITVPVGNWGVFQAQSATTDAFDEQDLTLAETLIAPLATMIERIEREAELRESNEALERQRRQIESLHTVATRMKSATSRQAVYEMAIEAVEEILEFDICIIDEAEGDVLVPRAVGSDMSIDDYYEETPIDEEDNLASLTYRKGQTFVVDDLHEAGYVPAQSRYKSIISLALDGRGVFQIASEEPAAFDRTERRLAELLAEHAVAAIDRIDRETELERRAEELEEQNARLDEFASLVSHDLRNPLNVATLRTEHALRTENLESLEAVQDALDRMETMIDNVLTLTRQGGAVDEPGPVDLQRLADRCWEQVPTSEASLTVESVIVRGDEDRLEHLFENLFHNAVEHGSTSPASRPQQDREGQSPSGSRTQSDDDIEGSAGEVTIEVGLLPGEDGFYVEDDGPGIDEEVRGEVFERGYTESESGTGLGLAIAAAVVDAHGWDVRVTDGEAGGARFEITGVDVVGDRSRQDGTGQVDS